MKRTILILVLAFSTGFAAMSQGYEKIKVTYEKMGDGLYDFYAENPNYCPMQFMLEFTELVNESVSCDLPFIATLNPGKQKIFSMRRVLVDIPGSFKYKTDVRLGGYPVKHTDEAIYQLPIGKGRTSKVSLPDYTVLGTPEKRVYSFTMQPGDTAFAAREGVVCQILQAKMVDGLMRGSNSILVLQPDNTFARYELFAPETFLVKLGDTIKAGTPLGLAEKVDGAQIQLSVFFTNARIDTIIANRIREPYSYIQPTFQLSAKKTGKLEGGVVQR